MGSCFPYFIFTAMEKSEIEGKKVNEKDPVEFRPWEKVGIGLVIVLIICSPYLLTQFDSGIHFTGMGEIGDVIGGITAPFVNLLAAYLVYKSFTAQISANKQQRDDHDEQMEQLNKEHSFNYISNYFELIKNKYPVSEKSTRFDGNESNAKKLISYISSFLDSDYYNKIVSKGGLTEDDKKHREAINVLKIGAVFDHLTVNYNISVCLKPIIDQTETIILFDNESYNSNLDEGIKNFYRLEIDKIIGEMELGLVISKGGKEKIENIRVHLSPDNRLNIKKLELNCGRLQDRGYRL